MSKSKAEALRLVWLRGSAVEFILPFDTYKEANAFRLRLYTFARPFRKPPDKTDEKAYAEFDWELHEAIEGAEVVCKEADGKWFCVCRPDWQNELVLKVYQAAGIEAGTGQEAEAKLSEQRLLDLIANGAADYQPTQEKPVEVSQNKYNSKGPVKAEEIPQQPPADDLYGDDV